MTVSGVFYKVRVCFKEGGNGVESIDDGVCRWVKGGAKWFFIKCGGLSGMDGCYLRGFYGL